MIGAYIVASLSLGLFFVSACRFLATRPTAVIAILVLLSVLILAVATADAIENVRIWYALQGAPPQLANATPWKIRLAWSLIGYLAVLGLAALADNLTKRPWRTP